MVFSLLLGVFFLPLQANAGFLSSIFGSEASASTESSNSSQTIKNSQNMTLLQANVSSASISSDKTDKTKDSKKNEVAQVDENENVNILSNNALVPASSPVAISPGGDSVDSSDDQVSVYVVRKGDSISQIADMFDVSANTILWANDMKKGDKLVEGDVLFILPVSGLKHTVTKGQTLKGIAKLYKVDVSEIAGFNGIAEDAPLAIGDELIIPDAQKAEESDKPIQNLNESIAKDKKYYDTHPVQNLSGYYVNPVPGARKSQGLHDRNGVDLAIARGTPIHAAAAGRVTLARNGYNGGFGNLVIISHSNGTETLYAHQSKLATHTGDQVTQGQVIGYVGSTGRSTGPHLHFEVHGARNPGADGSWAQ